MESISHVLCDGYPIKKCKGNVSNIVGMLVLCDECTEKLKDDLRKTIKNWRYRR